MIYRQNGRMHFLGGAAKKARLATLLQTLARQKGP